MLRLLLHSILMMGIHSITNSSRLLLVPISKGSSYNYYHHRLLTLILSNTTRIWPATTRVLSTCRLHNSRDFTKGSIINRSSSSSSRSSSRDIQIRTFQSTHSIWFGNRYNNSNKNSRTTNKNNQPQNNKATTKKVIRIQARPDHEKESDFQSKFALPNKEREQDISRLQVHVQELHKTGQYSKAVDAAEELLNETRQHFGATTTTSSNATTTNKKSSSSGDDDHHPAIAAAYNNLGLMYKLIGRFDDSRKQYMSALRIYKNTVGADHASYASVLHNIGNLNRNQIHIDDTLRATDRLSLIETAVQYLQDAYAIRHDELGINHPHTVASKSALGATLSTQILHHYRMTTSPTQQPSGDLVKRRFYLSLLPDDITETAWVAAEEHLRTALQTATDHPRGKSIIDYETKPASRRSGRQYQPTPVKPRRQQQVKPIMHKNEGEIVSSDCSNIATLSAAAAAQNLAIFLKCRATTVVTNDEKDSSISGGGSSSEENDNNANIEEENIRQQPTTTTSTMPTASTEHKKDWLEEAYKLYQQIMIVQAKLLPGDEQHPDRYATKFSYAELLDAMGDELGANTIRQEIIDTFDPPNTASSTTITTTGTGTDSTSPTTSEGKDEDVKKELVFEQ